MALLLEIILTLILIIAAIKLGWLGTILFVLLYIIAFSFKLPFLARRSKVTPQFLAFMAVFLTLGLFMCKLASVVLFSPDVQKVIGDQDFFNNILRFFLGTDLLKTFWSLVIGFGATVIIVGIPLVLYGYTAGQNMYSHYEQYKGHEWEAMQCAISNFLGINRGTWVVSNGEAELRGESASSLQRFGGPGILLTREGNAVILEISGKLSRVVGRGITWLKPFERISMVVPLQVRSEHIVLEHVTTQDRVSIDELEFWVYHKVDSGPPDEQIWNGLMPYNQRILIEMVWSPGGGDWSKAVRSVASTVGRDIFGRHLLEKLVTISDSFRANLKKELIDAINQITRDKMGITVTAVDFGEIKLSTQFRSKLDELWALQKREDIAESEGRIRVITGRAQAQAIESVESARALAQRQMILAIAQALQTAPDIAAPVVKLRFLEALEKIAQDPALKVLFPYSPDGLADGQGGIDLQRLQALLAIPNAGPVNENKHYEVAQPGARQMPAQPREANTTAEDEPHGSSSPGA